MADHLGHARRPGGKGGRASGDIQISAATHDHLCFRLLIAASVMTVALATRSSIGLSVLHDRAPLLVQMPDGNLRNGYTVKIVNKSQSQMLFELNTEGLGGGTLTEADEGLGPSDRLGLPVKADSVGTWRVLVSGRPDALVDGSQKIKFMLRNAQTGEETVYHSVFMGPR